VAEVLPLDGLTEGDLLELAAAVEGRSEHPIARAILDDAAKRGLAVPPSSAFTSLAGRGAEATVKGSVITVASVRVLTERGLALDPELVHASRDAAGEGRTVVYVLRDD